ncbi:MULTISPECIES: ABC transporter substrate-binding protein [unclassified Adlercreutzia]|uniref:ABC transporter substrate-binding protein n=1 Tax=unclassified Adlercreutzia TaxID=2636013 RepID=UPI0013ED1037|nr:MULTISPECIES: ABC transporter substrate-binding protein [unclassified Adlercreutzia]
MSEITRRSFVKVAGMSALAAALGGTLSGCAGAGSSGQSASSAGAAGDAGTKDQVVVSMTPGSEPAAGFDPLYSWGCGEHVHEPLIQSTLITTDVNLEFKNDLATSYECAPDGMTWTFTIRDDVRFTDGQPLTAEDVAFTVNGIINNEAAEADLSSVREARALDAVTVELAMAKPNNALLYTLAVVGIVPAHAYGADYGSNPVGSGRYVLEQWDRGQQVILAANPDYYGEAPLMKRVVVLFMEEDASLASAQSGQVDVAYTSATLAGAAPAGYELLDCKTVDSRGISLPCVPAGSPDKAEGDGTTYQVGNDVTCDLALRQALNYGVDRVRMIEHVLNGYGTEAWSVGDGMPWSSSDMRVEVDPDRARQMLEEGGWTAGADGVRAKDGVRAAFDLYYSAGDSTRQALAADFADQCKKLGIEVSVKGASWDDIYPHQYSDPVLWGWGSNAPVELYELSHSKGWGNYASYENAEVDANLDAALAQTDIEDSYAFYQKAQWDSETHTGVAPQAASTWVWLANVDHLYFQRTGLHVAEQKPHPHGHGWSLVNNVDKWEWR